ncbi:ornithine cyclodeaminase family protein [Actinomadura madurae]|uniref:ornithine cyclodeaminase family protein n=2 Tax=Actinomadura madurae TaxID=1993 RepID=UPI00202678F9|nr:ornithine cyclodeaminase family protein [Actinomadura madurae]URM93154.1 ornithine cyclodeaminase family protein [Actinomadura madurae]URN03878.1 ornithine cyclodeaminase family protein [Actinomadura madurae]
MAGVLLLSAADVAAVFDLPAAIASQRAAFAALGRGEARLAPRVLLDGPDGEVAFSYVSRLPGTGAVAKFGSVTPGNAARGLPTVAALVTVQDPVDGRPVAVIEGEAVTTLRTSAASAVAAGHLAAPDASRLAVIGCGVQGRAHVRAMAAVRPLGRVTMTCRQPETCTAAADLAAELELPVETAASARAAVEDAQIVVTATTSAEPVVSGAWLRPGCTVVSVGSFAPDRAEVDGETLTRAASVVVDDVPTALEHAGPVMAAVRDGLLDPGAVRPLGPVVAGLATGRASAADIVFYNSVGVGVQDTAAASVIVARAREAGVGRLVDL